MFTKAQCLRKRFLRLPQRKRDQARAYQRAKAAFPQPGSCLDPLPLPLVPTPGSGGVCMEQGVLYGTWLTVLALEAAAMQKGKLDILGFEHFALKQQNQSGPVSASHCWETA